MSKRYGRNQKRAQREEIDRLTGLYIEETKTTRMYQRMLHKKREKTYVDISIGEEEDGMRYLRVRTDVDLASFSHVSMVSDAKFIKEAIRLGRRDIMKVITKSVGDALDKAERELNIPGAY